MKYTILTLIITGMLFATQASSVYAVTPTVEPTATVTKAPSPADEKLTDQINKLKERVASRVAELKLVEKRGAIGVVMKTSDTQITITDVNNRIRLIDVDEITKFSSPSAKGSFGISDITKGTKIAVVGLYNKQSKRILARFVTVVTVPTFVNGTVKKVNAEDFTVTVVTEDNKQYVIDIEKITKTLAYEKGEGLVKAGFSDIAVGQRVNIIGYDNIKEKNRITGSRVLLYPTLPKNPKIKVVADAVEVDEDEPVVSTGSGKKLTPVTR